MRPSPTQRHGWSQRCRSTNGGGCNPTHLLQHSSLEADNRQWGQPLPATLTPRRRSASHTPHQAEISSGQPRSSWNRLRNGGEPVVADANRWRRQGEGRTTGGRTTGRGSGREIKSYSGKFLNQPLAHFCLLPVASPPRVFYSICRTSDPLSVKRPPFPCLAPAVLPNGAGRGSAETFYMR